MSLVLVQTFSFQVSSTAGDFEEVSCFLDPANTQHMSGSMARGWGPRAPPGWCPRLPPGWCPRPPPGWCQALLDALVRSLKLLCCTVAPQLLFSSPAVLGTIQMLVGSVTVGLGPGRTSTSPGDLTQLGAPYWLGSVFLVAGILCVLSGDYPTAGLLGVTVFMNICGAIFAITGIVLYSIDLSNSSLTWMCRSPSHREHYAVHHRGYATPSSYMLHARHNQEFDDECRAVAHVAEGLLSMMDILLIILTVLQLCVNISTTILGIQALTQPRDHDQTPSGRRCIFGQGDSVHELSTRAFCAPIGCEWHKQNVSANHRPPPPNRRAVHSLPACSVTGHRVVSSPV
ncbi:hypothetical protein N1851_002035 [Merluccius polli]|uniref:Uncharacterized protein n=1 Tax=Merluccius polli TaxID=89951 RepID=A0AA47PBA3_MERPO|nr:hypothetical protein N1851_002035 [Merluccius polli]